MFELLTDFPELFGLYKPENQPVPGSLRRLTGGFSGADVYGYEATGGTFVLRGWPGNTVRLHRLRELAELFAYLADRQPIPIAVPIRSLSGEKHVFHQGRFWHIEPFLYGQPLATSDVNENRLRTIMHAVADCHRALADFRPTSDATLLRPAATGYSPALRRREELLSGYLRQSPSNDDRVFSFLEKLGPLLLLELSRFSQIKLPLQPVFRDLWRDHVLFENERITGLIDLNASATDSVLCDLSRLLGSLIGNDADKWQFAIHAYQTRRRLSSVELKALSVFDLSNLLLSAIKCQERLQQEQDSEIRTALASRLDEYLKRLDGYARWGLV